MVFNPISGKFDLVGSSSSGSGTVGIGTVNRMVVQIGTTTTGTPANINVDSNGNFGVGTTTPQALIEIETGANQDIFRVDDATGTDTTPFIIEANGNVGIGTPTPSAVLSVSSTLVQDLFRVDDNGAGDLSPFIVDKDGNVGIGTSNTQADKLLVMGGNVGIGTWVPAQALDVLANIRTAASVFANNVGVGTTLTGTATLAVMNGNVGIGTWKPVNLMDIKGAASIGYTDTSAPSNGLLVSGNVGIGTTIPEVVLEVTGLGAEVEFVNTTANKSKSWIGTYNNGTRSLIQFSSNRRPSTGAVYDSSKPTSYVNIESNPSHGLISFATTNTNNNSAPPILMTIDGNGAVGIGTDNPRNAFNVVGNMAVGATGNVGLAAPASGLYVQGATGLGTLLPSSQLSVGGNTSIGAAYSTIAAPASGMIIQGNTGIKTSAPLNALDVNGGMVVGSYAGVNTAPSNGIISSGNIGIGTALTTTALNVAGTFNDRDLIRLQNTAADGYSTFGFFDNTGAQQAGIGYGNASSAATLASRIFFSSNNKDIIFSKDLGATVSWIWKSTGNTGIGTLQPSSLLEVGVQKFNVLSGGNVGIGSVSPGSVLDVQGSVRFLGAGITGSVKTGTNTVCTTTCGSSRCLLGQDAGTAGVLNSLIVTCSDASADICVCMGN